MGKQGKAKEARDVSAALGKMLETQRACDASKESSRKEERNTEAVLLEHLEASKEHQKSAERYIKDRLFCLYDVLQRQALAYHELEMLDVRGFWDVPYSKRYRLGDEGAWGTRSALDITSRVDPEMGIASLRIMPRRGFLLNRVYEAQEEIIPYEIGAARQAIPEVSNTLSLTIYKAQIPSASLLEALDGAICDCAEHVARWYDKASSFTNRKLLHQSLLRMDMLSRIEELNRERHDVEWKYGMLRGGED